MPLLIWGPQYSVGVREIDTQHRNLIKLINEMHQALSHRAGEENVASVLRRALNYTEFHFSTEERLMAQYGYPLAVAHAADHLRLLDRARALQTRLLAGEAGVPVEAFNLLSSWLNDHIQKVDEDLGRFLVGKGLV